MFKKEEKEKNIEENKKVMPNVEEQEANLEDKGEDNGEDLNAIQENNKEEIKEEVKEDSKNDKLAELTEKFDKLLEGFELLKTSHLNQSDVLEQLDAKGVAKENNTDEKRSLAENSKADRDAIMNFKI